MGISDVEQRASGAHRLPLNKRNIGISIYFIKPQTVYIHRTGERFNGIMSACVCPNAKDHKRAKDREPGDVEEERNEDFAENRQRNELDFVEFRRSGSCAVTLVNPGA